MLSFTPPPPVDGTRVNDEVVVGDHQRCLAGDERGPRGVLRQLPHQAPLGAGAVQHGTAVGTGEGGGFTATTATAVVQHHKVEGC